MAADKYLGLANGIVTEKAGAQTSTANAIAAMDATGKLNLNMMPAGIGAEVESIMASEALLAGDFVNKWNDSGTPKVRKADASTGGKEANGFVLAGAGSGNMVDVYAIGGVANNQMSGMTIGARQYLSDANAGKTIESPPVGATKVVQSLGRATSATVLVPVYTDPITLA